MNRLTKLFASVLLLASFAVVGAEEDRLMENPNVDRLLKLVALVEQDKNASPELRWAVLDHCCRVLYNAERYPEAAEAATKAIELGHHNVDMYWYRAHCYSTMNELRKAVADYTSLLEREISQPGRIVSLSERGIVYSKLGEQTEALADFDEALRLDPKNTDVLTQRAWLRKKEKNYDGAIDDLDEVLRQDPKNTNALTCRALSRHGTKNYDGAIDDYLKVIAEQPDSPDAYLLMGYVYCEVPKFDKGAEAFSKAIEMGTNRIADAHWLRGNCYRMLGDDRAMADMAKAAKLDPEQYREPFEEKEQTQRAVADPEFPAEKALELLTQALAKDTEDPRLYTARARRYVEQKEWKKAMDDLNETVRLVPNGVTIRWGQCVVCLYPWDEKGRSDVLEALVEDAVKLLDAIPHDDVVVEKKDLLKLRGLLRNDQKENE